MRQFAALDDDDEAKYTTGGALALAAYVGQSKASPEEQQKLFIRMFLLSAMGVAFVSILGGLDLYDFVAGEEDVAKASLWYN